LETHKVTAQLRGPTHAKRRTEFTFLLVIIINITVHKPSTSVIDEVFKTHQKYMQEKIHDYDGDHHYIIYCTHAEATHIKKHT